MTMSREDTLRHEKGKALVRALHLSELAAASKARELALHEAESQFDRVARLLPDALNGGISMTEIARVTGISRPTLYELRARYGGSVGDLRLAILQAIIANHAVTVAALSERLGRPSKDISLVVEEFLSGDLLHEDVEEVGPEEWEQRFYVTSNGLAFLEHWEFELAEADDEKAGDRG
jgi:hypothetical protein